MDAGETYRAFIEAVNDHDLQHAERLVDVERYRENCVGFTRGFVTWPEAKESIQRVWRGIPDLRVDLRYLAEVGEAVVAHGTVRGTATGRLYGAPATGKSYEAIFFDYVRVGEVGIVERIQQVDILSQMRQLYGRSIGLIGVASTFLRLPATPGVAG
jgi:predicted ester cyclase